MENKNGQGIFYGVIGVATLVVAIIGATFAYFSAGAQTNTVTGTTGSGATLTLSVTPAASTTGALIPLKYSTQFGSALTGVNGVCKDSNANTVCNIYTITVTNTSASTTPLSVRGDVTVDSTATNIKWRVISSADGTTFSDGSGTTYNASSTAQNIVASELLNNTTPSATYYIAVWLEETGNPQDVAEPDTQAGESNDAGKSYTGTVTFSAIDSSGNASTGLTATFTS